MARWDLITYVSFSSLEKPTCHFRFARFLVVSNSDPREGFDDLHDALVGSPRHARRRPGAGLQPDHAAVWLFSDCHRPHRSVLFRLDDVGKRVIN
jgi:hypothetical protein